MNLIIWMEYFFLMLLEMLAATMIIFCALNERMLLLPVWYRIGLICSALGFAAQVVISAPYLLFGKIVLVDELLPRMLKDAGIAIVATHYFWLILRDRRKPGTPLTKKAPVKRKPAVKKVATAATGRSRKKLPDRS